MSGVGNFWAMGLGYLRNWDFVFLVLGNEIDFDLSCMGFGIRLYSFGGLGS